MNCTVGDINGNATRIISICHELENIYDCRLVAFPELSLTGYPPEDLLFRDDFVAEVERELARIVDAIGESLIFEGLELTADDWEEIEEYEYAFV